MLYSYACPPMYSHHSYACPPILLSATAALLSSYQLRLPSYPIPRPVYRSHPSPCLQIPDDTTQCEVVHIKKPAQVLLAAHVPLLQAISHAAPDVPWLLMAAR